MHAFGDVDPVSSARFATGDSFAVSSTPIDRNTALLEAGVDFTITPASTLSFTYNGQIGSNTYDHGANAKLRVKF
ncbi:Extracellular serine protease precursor [compost metagenome]